MISVNLALVVLLLNLALLPLFVLAGFRLRRRMNHTSRAMREVRTVLRPLEVRPISRTDRASKPASAATRSYIE